MEIALSMLVGLGLSAAAGFRVFVPLLVVSLAAKGGMVDLASEFAWVGSTPALVAFAVATLLEVGAYYIPWLDNVLDTLTSPLAVMAGAVLTAAVVTDLDPFLKWTMAIVAGGGMAGVVQAKTVVARGLSSATTGGLANPVVATAELGGALTASALSVLMPLVAGVLVLAVMVWLLRGRKGRGGAAEPAPPAGRAA